MNTPTAHAKSLPIRKTIFGVRTARIVSGFSPPGLVALGTGQLYLGLPLFFTRSRKEPRSRPQQIRRLDEDLPGAVRRPVGRRRRPFGVRASDGLVAELAACDLVREAPRAVRGRR